MPDARRRNHHGSLTAQPPDIQGMRFCASEYPRLAFAPRRAPRSSASRRHVASRAIGTRGRKAARWGGPSHAGAISCLMLHCARSAQSSKTGQALPSRVDRFCRDGERAITMRSRVRIMFRFVTKDVSLSSGTIRPTRRGRLKQKGARHERSRHQAGSRRHSVVSRDEWLAARKAHLENEKALTRMRDRIAAERRSLPWVWVEKNYVFDTVDGKKTLAHLFDGRSQLIVYHFMWGGIWTRAATAARSWPIISTAPTCISPTTMSNSWRCRAGLSTGSTPTGNAWVAIPVRVIIRQRLQLRLSCLVRAGRAGEGQDLLQLRNDRRGIRRAARAQRVLQGQEQRRSFTPIRPMRAAATF